MDIILDGRAVRTFSPCPVEMLCNGCLLWFLCLLTNFLDVGDKEFGIGPPLCMQTLDACGARP
jgi:hypothetical protein